MWQGLKKLPIERIQCGMITFEKLLNFENLFNAFKKFVGVLEDIAFS